MKIRTATANDLEQVLALYEGLAGPWPLPTGDVALQKWHEILAHQGTQVIGVEEGAILIAIATLHILPNMTFSGKPYALVENVVVAKDRQGRGIGKKLMQAVVDKAWDADAYKIMLLTGKTNGAKRFYASIGFTDEEKFGMTLRRAPKRYGA